MLARRNILGSAVAILAVTLSGARSLAAEQSAKDFLGSIYASYKGKNAKGIKLTRGARARYFTPGLARLIESDEKDAVRNGEIPTLGADPFIDAQDFEINAFAIDVKDTAPDKAVGTVKFKNMKEDAGVTLDLVKTKNGWRIDDIHWPKWSLRALLEQSAPFIKKK